MEHFFFFFLVWNIVDLFVLFSWSHCIAFVLQITASDYAELRKTSYSSKGRCDQMWILTNSTDVKSTYNHIFARIAIAFDFSALYTTIPHSNRRRIKKINCDS